MLQHRSDHCAHSCVSKQSTAGLSFGHDKVSPHEGTDAAELPDLAVQLPSWKWWAARLLAVNQRLLTRSAASLRSALQTLMPQVRHVLTAAAKSVLYCCLLFV